MGQMTVEQWYGTIKTGLTKKLTENKEALPAGFNQQRFILNCITVIQDMMKDDKKKAQLEKINPETIPVCLAKAAYLGLDFFNGECYAIPYGGNLSFQTDYKGEIKLCKRYSKNKIKDIFAKVVREEVVYRNTGLRLPFYIAAGTKEEEPNIEVIQVTQNYLDEAKNMVEMNMPRILRVKNGEVEPDRCEMCDCCRHTKVLKRPISITNLVAGI